VPGSRPFWPYCFKFRQHIPTSEQLQSLQITLIEALGYPYRLEWQIHAMELPLTASGKFEEFMPLLPESGTAKEAQ
jgi:hypothetical protein